MAHLTPQERWVLTLVLTLLLIGWAVKAWRTAHPPPAPRALAQPVL
jgi:ABC-type transport system involved in cytochrome c biogenesis permease subunit